MDLNEITKILTESGIHVCAVCGTPFKPYHSRQKTCGSPDCKRIHHNRYVQERAKRLFEEDPDAWRKYHANANRKYMHKKRAIEKREAELKEIQERWERQSALNEKIAEYGHEYGKRSAEKVLATVPKIDVNLGGKSDDRMDSKDDPARS